MDIKADEISKIIRDQLGNYALDIDVAEVGTVISVGDGIARVHGVEGTMATEMLEFFAPLNDLSLKYTVMQNALVATDRIFALFEEPTEPADRPNAVAVAGNGAVEFRGVSFSYESSRAVLHEVSFSIRAGERVAASGIETG